jgi:glycosyltransferase involved in cell wall biosynthesis
MTNSRSAAATLAASHDGRKRLIVEGWRFLPHSYAIVNQWQLLALRRKNIDVKVIDAPFYRAAWRPQDGIFDSASEQALRSLELARPGESADATLRIFAPFTFSPSRSRRTAVFATLEQQLVQRNQMRDAAEYEMLRRRSPPPDITVITPSQWSARGFYRAGFDPKQVHVIPHGADCAIFRPMAEARDEMRRGSQIPDDDFVFLSVGAMSGNKGIDLLLRGFATLRRRLRNVRLILKGIDGVYGSRNLLLQSLRTLTAKDQELVLEKMTYIGAALSNEAMASLYQIADTYVSPYRAEGFNIPVLEAAACGIPIICTRGGPTDDFVTDEFARRRDSTLSVVAADGQDAVRLEPDLASLIALMALAIENDSWRKNAAEAGPRHVSAHYTWDDAGDKLITALLT